MVKIPSHVATCLSLIIAFFIVLAIIVVGIKSCAEKLEGCARKLEERSEAPALLQKGRLLRKPLTECREWFDGGASTYQNYIARGISWNTAAI